MAYIICIYLHILAISLLLWMYLRTSKDVFFVILIVLMFIVIKLINHIAVSASAWWISIWVCSLRPAVRLGNCTFGVGGSTRPSAPEEDDEYLRCCVQFSDFKFFFRYQKVRIEKVHEMYENKLCLLSGEAVVFFPGKRWILQPHCRNCCRIRKLINYLFAWFVCYALLIKYVN